MKKSIYFLGVLFVFFFLRIPSLPALPLSQTEAAAWVEQTGSKLIEALGNPDKEEKYQILDQMFLKDIDTDYAARFVLGKYWKILTPEQQKTYTNLFQKYLLNLYKSYPLDFDTKGLDFHIISTKNTGAYTNVSCRINIPEKYATEALKTVDVEFKLSSDGSAIQIVDLKIAESSLLLTYRNRFQTMIKDVDEDMEWFLEDFEDLAVSNERHVSQE